MVRVRVRVNVRFVWLGLRLESRHDSTYRLGILLDLGLELRLGLFG
jgi:hypothetical protein